MCITCSSGSWLHVIGAEAAGRLAAVLGQCTSLAHLNFQGNGIGDEGAGRLAAVLGQCRTLAHLILHGNGIGAEGVGRLVAVAERCPSLTIYFEWR
jgi:Ran GTPase-activating protein (RanGAP) involved in mRNA processing and transport